MPRPILSVKLNNFKDKLIRKNFFANRQTVSKSTVIAMFGLIIISSAFYLWQTNNLATRGYKIKDLDDQVSELRQQNKKMELSIAQLRSTERINKEVANLQMVTVARVEYLQKDGTAVALNR